MPAGSGSVDHAAVRDALAGVVDPCCREREISVLDMGLLHAIDVDDDHVRVEIILTSGWCPFQLDLVDTITDAVDALPGVAATDVAITLDEAWSTARLSDDARRKLQFLPDPAAVDRDAFLAERLRTPLPVVAGADAAPSAPVTLPSPAIAASPPPPTPVAARPHPTPRTPEVSHDR